ncbi:PLATZ transcription factor family protein [Chloropicon primus]|uniref:PLATZ transcription factor n=1 Tax=Chloropicon primus TaxID=1764295 RepID=A0A5B8MMS6_9CHLO|nr:hypothetical protein A3770_06p42150 [Chloropicon primus]UPR00918.1 PLATZ transcription factor family protein [Chloropicon primus]|mmetsp:Transcript_86/g.203  ORF Transcript_86/g.203 Transcript_86/m.203 type:complete len:261 (+) Transcript_86:382-1164(+)|eukprot:QDZ21697.1 hypothetical protein A3770_06p42150 [Chloropicon primus]
MEGKENKQGVGKSEGKVPNAVEWLPVLISPSTGFFKPCARCSQLPSYATESHKAVVNFLCLTCAEPHGICQLCMHEHASHHILQIRRSSYHDVVRERELSKLVNTSGIQTYIINSSQVVFLRERPQSRNKSSGGSDAQSEGCVTCGRHLHEGLSYCSLGCKVKHCTRGQAIGKKLPPDLELVNKPRGLSYYVDFQPHTPQLKQKSPSQGNKRRKKSMGTPTKGEAGNGYYSSSTTTTTSPHQTPQRHRRKKSTPRQSPYK